MLSLEFPGHNKHTFEVSLAGK